MYEINPFVKSGLIIHDPPARLGPAAAASKDPKENMTASSLDWADSHRASAFAQWLAAVAPQHALQKDTVRLASADASFRRYFRIQCADGKTSRIIMDAPPEHENCQPFVHVAELMQQAGLPAPQILHWHTACGFMLLTDLGQRTMMSALDPANPSAAQPYFTQAIELLLQWQSASRPNVLPPYDSALLQRELQLFPDWYLRQHRQIEPTTAQAQTVYDVVGPICESGDWIGRDRSLAVQPGDRLAVLSAGAYCMAMASNYNTRGRAAEVLVSGTQADVIRQRETPADTFRGETLR